MAEHKLVFKKTQITFRSSSRLLKAVVIVLILVSGVTLAVLRWIDSNISHRTDLLRTEAAEVVYENEELKRNIGELGTMQGVERIAEEELGMVYPDTVLIEAQVK